MAQFRNIQTSFWTDAKVIDNFTPEDRYFYLYLMTNPHTSLCGCYEISMKQMADETGYAKETIERLVERMRDFHKVIEYSKETKEVLILNWHKYNWTESENVKIGILTGISKVKCENYKAYLFSIFKGSEDVSIGSTYPMPTTLYVSNNTTNNQYVNEEDISKEIKDIKSNKKDIEEVVEYLNQVCGTRYKAKTKATSEYIGARLKDGFTVADCKRVVDVKAAEWLRDPKMSQYLRPITLFAPSKFEGYLNQPMPKKPDDDFLKGFV